MSETKQQRNAEPKVYIGKLDGETRGLFKATHANTVRSHILADVPPPAVEVRPVTVEEAMELALDGIVVKDLTAPPPEPAPASEPLADGAGGDDPFAEDGKPDLNDTPRINPDDDDSDDAVIERARRQAMGVADYETGRIAENHNN